MPVIIWVDCVPNISYYAEPLNLLDFKLKCLNETQEIRFYME